MISIEVVAPDQDLGRLVGEINAASWDAANGIRHHDAEAMTRYLEREDTVFVACHEVVGERRTLLGIASGRFQRKPYDAPPWLYVDEIDVCADQRRRGIGTRIMRRLLDVAAERGSEVWLATEPDNHAANALYRSLAPADVEQVIGYTFRSA